MKCLEYPFDNDIIINEKKHIKQELLKQGNFIQKKIAILSGSTIGVIKDILELFLLHNGIEPIFYVGTYGKYYEDVMWGTELQEFKPDVIYINTSSKNITELPNVKDSFIDVNNKLDRTFKQYIDMWSKIEKKYGCVIIQNNFEYYRYRILGNKDICDYRGKNNFINRLNNMMYEYAENANFYINDINYLSSWYGVEKWTDPSYWYLYKYALNIDAIPLLCHSISNIIKSIYGKNKKAIVLDLDNTLWGGIIGDCGIDGIDIGIQTAQGNAYYDFQQYLKEIKDLGVLLNVCSKNDLNIAIKPFEHSSSILKKDDFTVFKANWENKDKNIISIHKQLNILPDSIVFIDDNPAERLLTKINIPQITTPEINNPENNITILDKSGFFEVTRLSDEDMQRNKYYKANNQRYEFESNLLDYDEYLRLLEMTCIIGFKTTDLERVSQLINKTNQFNLNGNKSIEINSSKYITFNAKLKDKFGDNGLVSTLIAGIDTHGINIVQWVMSCRVFKRNLEFVMFDYLVLRSINLNKTYIKCNYIDTGKNSVIKDTLKRLGFINNLYTIPRDYKRCDIMEVSYEGFDS